MTLTQLYAKLGPRLGPYVGLADLDDAIASGLNELGCTLSAGPAVVDADLLAVAAADYNQFEDLAVARAYETILLNLTDKLLCEHGIEEKAADLRPMFLKLLAQVQDRLRDRYGVGRGTVGGGSVDLGFAQTGECWNAY